MTRRLSVVLALCASTTLACDRTQPASTQNTPAPQTAAALAQTTPATTQPPQKLAAKRAAPVVDEEAVRAQMKLVRDALREGRTLVQADKLKQGIAAFERALEVNPHDARVLSEVGWAAFKDQQLDRALDATRQSVALTLDPSVKGASLYNLGRIYEERGERDRAAQAYKQSLEVRPGNKIVKARLDALMSTGAQLASQQCAMQPLKLKPDQDPCAAHTYALIPDESGYYTEALCYEDAAPKRLTVATSVGELQVVAFRYEHRVESGGYDDVLAVAVIGPKGAHVYDLARAHTPGIAYVYGSVTLDEVLTQQVDGAGAPEVLIRYTVSVQDGNYSMNTMELSERSYVSALKLDGPKPSWLATVTTRELYTSGAWLDDMPAVVDMDPLPETRTETNNTIDWMPQSAQLAITLQGRSAAPVIYDLSDYPARCPGEPY